LPLIPPFLVLYSVLYGFTGPLYSTDPAIGTHYLKEPVKQCKTTVLLTRFLVHFKNSVSPGVAALLNGPLSKTPKTVKTPFSTVF